MTTAAHTADYLASFCFASEGGLARDLERIAHFARACVERVRYWEIIYVVPDHERAGIDASAELLARINGLRILLVRTDTSYYRRRAIAASEAIGDVVVLGSLQELSAVDLIDLADESFARNSIMLVRRSGRGRVPHLFHALLRAVSPYRVSAADLRTIALPRAPLVDILGRPTATIDLRFEPKASNTRYERKLVALPPGLGGRSSDGRFAFLAEIVSASAPRFLRMYATVSGVVFIVALLYAVYAVVVVATLDNVQPGWFTTNLAQSGSVAFLALGFIVFALGLARMVERGDAGTSQGIVDEIGNVSFFDRAPSLNVQSER